MRKTILLILIVTFLFSCNKQERKLEIFIDKAADADGIIRDYPNYYEGFYKDLRIAQEKSIGLTSLENGTPHFQIRILKDFHDLTGWILVLIDSSGNWQSNLFTFNYVARNHTPDSLNAKKVFSGVPKSGWKNFISKLASSEILTLPDARSLENYSIGSDETGMIIQIADKKHFRYYQYAEPYYRQKMFKEARKAVDILELLQKEFPIDRRFRQKEFE